MKSVIIVDTDIIVQYLRTGKGILPAAYEKYSMVISVSTFSELLASTTFKDAGLEKEVLEFVEKYFTIKDMNKEIAHSAAKLIREHGLTLATAYTAATAMSESAPILTEDKNTFNKIPNISFVAL
jgi:predicted nucleic acid-binding protein